MREIKFRGKKFCQDEWIYGSLITRGERGADGNFIDTGRGECYPLQQDTICQFTGLRDKNGKEIYEGDIIQRMYEMEVGNGRNRHIERAPVANDTPKVIDFRNGAFGYVNFFETAYQYEEWLPLLDELCEVIGNIYDNPELLKVGEEWI